MGYYNYHATAKRLIKEGKLIGYYYTKRYKHITPALVLVFNDHFHHIMPIREYRWVEYIGLLDKSLEVDTPNDTAK